MKIAYNWVKRYLDIDTPAEELSTILTDIGLEVEGLEEVETIKGGLKGVVIGKVLSAEQHPNADKLKVTKVDVGEDEPLDIVCGAPNVAAGQHVVVATVGSVIYPTGMEEGLKLKKAKIRGEVSMGMICAEDELGLGTSHDGIMVLPEDAFIGKSAAEYFNIESDYVFEIGLTPNRADAMSHFGVARDIAAYYEYNNNRKSLNAPKVSIDPKGDCPVNLTVDNPDACPKYLGLVIDGVEVKDSPDWLRNSLLSIGLTPINNVVDVTNFVLHGLGQPLHAFDNTVVNGAVVVRNARAGEKFTTLDGEERELHQDDLMICNASEPMCIAGVFGGEKSGVTESTTSVFLESAYFDPVSIRKTAKRHGLHTDASFRFERGIDPNITEYALKYAAELIVEVAGGNIQGCITGSCVVIGDPHKVAFNPEAARTLLGENIQDDKFKKAFQALEIKVEDTSEEWICVVPAYRVDVTRQADLVEEFLRIHGFNQIQTPAKFNATAATIDKKDSHRLRNAVCDMLTSRGYREVLNNSLTRAEYSEVFAKNGGKSSPVSMLNPLSNELNVMRESMLFGLLETAVYNQNRQHPDLKIYEFGKVYRSEDEGSSESYVLGLLVTGNKHEEHWDAKENKSSFFTLKSSVESIFEQFGLKPTVAEISSAMIQDGIALKLGEKIAANIGVVSSGVRKKFDLKAEAYFAELMWDVLIRKYKPGITFSEISKFPEVRRDLSLLLNKSVRFADVRQSALGVKDRILKDVHLFDVYTGDKLGQDQKSYAISFTIQDETKTLTDKHVEQLMEKIISNLKNDLGAELR